MLFISGISMAAIGLYARRFVGRVPAATPFILLMFCAAAWSILYALDILTPVLPLRVFYHNLRFLFLPFFSVLELWLVVAYVNRQDWIRRDYAVAILIVPLIAAILAITSPYHTLFRYNFSINLTTPVPVLHFTESLFYQVYFIYSFVLLALAILLLIMESRRQGTLREMPTILLLIALAFPTIVNYITQIYQIPFPGINPAPALLWIAAILYLVALFRYRFLDIIPIARSRLIEALSGPVLVLDTDGRIIDLNPAAGSLFSALPATIQGRAIGEVAPDWPDLATLCSEGTPQTRNLIRSTPGGARYYIGSVEPLTSSGDVTEGHLVFLQDVTGLRNTEDALRQKTEELGERVKELRCLYEIARIIETEQPVDEHLQKFADIIPSGWRYPDLTCARIRVENRVFQSRNFRESSDKLVCPIMIHQTPVGEIEVYYLGDSGSPHLGPFLPEESDLINAIAERISRMYERIQVEQALRESEEKYRMIIEEMQDLFYRTDINGKITMLSPSAFTIAGYSPEELIGQDATIVYADKSEREKLLAILKERGSVDSFPLKLKTRDGSIRSVTTSSHFYRDANGKIAGVEGVIHDVTELHRAEEALRMANKKLNLLSSVTRHDIRNQLMALMAFLELSQEAINNPQELEEFLKKNQKIAKTISDQITFTKAYEDLGVNAPAWQNIRKTVENAASGLPLRSTRITIETGDLEIFADPLVEKVFYNLIDNSLRYGGEAMNSIRVTSHPSDRQQILVFEDNGPGISDRDKNVIFDKGFGKNTGLGLYLSREILAITGITISETGEPGKGARFEMTVPEGGFRLAGTP